MHGDLAAKLTILFRFQPLRMPLSVFHCRVISIFTIGTF
jgi:hypothetical protein